MEGGSAGRGHRDRQDRDLKPANIRVREDGTVKVLDFGLAKAIDPGSGAGPDGLAPHPLANSPTISGHVTMAGVILGTAAYMSPEQAAGKVVDKRSDLWAFGVVLMEMLTGQHVFDGETMSHVIAAVLTQNPDWSTLPPSTPEPIRKLLRRCLERDRRRRLDSAAAARFEIDDAVAALRGAANPASPVNVGTGATRSSQGRVALPWALGALAAVVAALATSAVTRTPPPEAAQPSRFAIVPPAGQTLGISGGGARDLAVSLDGSRLVYIAGAPPRLMVRAFDQLDAVALPGIPPAFAPFLSPDGRWAGYFTGSGGGLQKVSITGGPPVRLYAVAQLRGASWGDDDMIVFATGDPATGLFRIAADGGEPTVLTTPDPARGLQAHVFPSVLPGGRGVLFTIMSAGGAANGVVAVLDAKTGQQKTLIRGGNQAEYVEPGFLIYAAAGSLQAVRFDLATLEVLGDPVPLGEQVMTHASGAANFSVSRRGTLVYAPARVGDNTARSLVWVTRQGIEEPIAASPRAYAQPRLSPDGTRIAVAITDRESDIAIWDLAGRTLTALTSGPDEEICPVWTPDGHRLIFSSTRGDWEYLWPTGRRVGHARTADVQPERAVPELHLSRRQASRLPGQLPEDVGGSHAADPVLINPNRDTPRGANGAVPSDVVPRGQR